MDKDIISVAFCRKQQGIRGEMKVSVLLDNPDDIYKISALKLENEPEFHSIDRIFKISGDYGIKLSGVDTVDMALKFKSKYLYAKKSEVDKLKPEDTFYIDELIGKSAVFEDGEVIGTISDIENYGANDIVFIKSTKFKNLSFANIGGIITSAYEDKVMLNREEFFKVCVFDEV